MKLLLDKASVGRTATAPLSAKAAASVQIVDPLAVANWDELVTVLPGHSFFHSSAWARTLEESYGYKPVYFAMVENGAIRALLPMMEVDSWLTGKRGVSLPFSDVCEVLPGEVGRVAPRAPDYDATLLEQAIQHGRENGWKYFEVRGAISDARGAGRPTSSEFFGHTLELSRDEEKIFGGFESSVRRAIRKAEKSGVKVEISRSLDGVKEFYALHCLTRQKHGTPPQPFSFFVNFHRNVIAHNLGFVVIARFEGRPVAASVFVHFGTKAIYKYGASDENFQNLRGANLVMWHAIQWYARAGFDRLDFGRTEKANEGLRRFKLGWGASEHLINYFKYDLRAQRFIAGKDGASLLRERVFKRIPIPIARMIGSVLYRHVA
jgi:CelD/BcsL family acetyltransferase involved in cellulose biosynthesis